MPCCSGTRKNRSGVKLPAALLSALLTALLMVVLAACSGPTEAPTPAPGEPGGPGTAPPPPLGRTLTTWTVDPGFRPDTLADPETRAWYRQVGVEIAREVAVECVPEGTPPEEQEYFPASSTTAACSAIKHYVGRGLNYYVTSLLSVFRTTGDPALLAEIDRVLELVRSRLRDTDGDGYRNLYYLALYGPDDFNPKEDSLAHGFLAEVAYVFGKNGAYSTPEHPYAERAAFWTDYLRGDFEAKWAGRGETAEGLPVDRLMHPFMEILRYSVYMAKLFPDDPKYRRFSERLSSIVLSEFKTDPTPSGDAFVWSHVVRLWDPQLQGDPAACLSFQMGTYPQQTMTAFVDLALEGHPGFSDTLVLQKLSRTLSESVMTPTPLGFLYKDVGGLRHGLLEPNRRKDTVIGGWCFQDASYSNGGGPTENFRGEGSYGAIPWALLAAFVPETDLTTSEIYRVNTQLYGDPLAGEIAAKRISIPAAMAFARLYRSGGFTLER